MAHCNRLIATISAGLGLLGCQARTVSIEFLPTADGEVFRCTSAWTLGTNKVIAQPLDARVTLSHIELLTASGAVGFELDENSLQRDGLGLLDFEDATGTCSGGDGVTSYQLQGAPMGAGPFTGLRFRFGAGPSHQGSLAFLPRSMLDSVTGRPVGISASLVRAGKAWPLNWSGDDVTVQVDGVDATKSIVSFDFRALYAPFEVGEAGCSMPPSDSGCDPVKTALGAQQQVIVPTQYLVGQIDHQSHSNH